MSAATRRLRALPANPADQRPDLSIWEACQSFQLQTARQAYLIRKMIVDHQDEINQKDADYDRLEAMFIKEKKEHNKVKAFLEALSTGRQPL